LETAFEFAWVTIAGSLIVATYCTLLAAFALVIDRSSRGISTTRRNALSKGDERP
jgi:hypothetical protein